MFRLAHISDLHLSPIPKLTMAELCNKRITGYVNWIRHRRHFHHPHILQIIMDEIAKQNAHHLAITGDLVNLATTSEIDQAHKWLIANAPTKTSSLVPGNHDSYVPGAFRKITSEWKPWFISDTMPNEPQNNVQSPFPYIHIRGPIAIIGLSTSNATLPLQATGHFSKHQANKAAELLEYAKKRDLFRVIMIHHPPYQGATHNHKRMTGLQNFETMIGQSGAELVIHGHTHLNTTHMLRRDDRQIPIVGIASASQDRGDKKPVAGFNLFDISKENGIWACIHQRFALHDTKDTVELTSKNKII